MPEPELHLYHVWPEWFEQHLAIECSYQFEAGCHQEAASIAVNAHLSSFAIEPEFKVHVCREGDDISAATTWKIKVEVTSVERVDPPNPEL